MSDNTLRSNGRYTVQMVAAKSDDDQGYWLVTPRNKKAFKVEIRDEIRDGGEEFADDGLGNLPHRIRRSIAAYESNAKAHKFEALKKEFAARPDFKKRSEEDINFSVSTALDRREEREQERIGQRYQNRLAIIQYATDNLGLSMSELLAWVRKTYKVSDIFTNVRWWNQSHPDEITEADLKHLFTNFSVTIAPKAGLKHSLYWGYREDD